MRLLSYNIKHGGAGRERQLAAVIAAVDPDVVVLQEATRPPVVEQLARDTGMRQWGARRGQSLGFMSRAPMAHVAWHRPRLSRHAFLELVPADGAWRIFGVHLSAVHAAWTERRRHFELRAMLAAIRRHQHGPHVLVGDFNTLAPGELLDVRKLPSRLRALVWLSGGRIRWRTIQTVLDAGYCDAFRHVHPDVVGSTFPTWDPHVRLDYLFVPEPFVGGVDRCEVICSGGVRDASDHLPFMAELRADTAAITAPEVSAAV
jgi:endonuclease/exonuclease/phosphatase family metal-dependent hydrolase